MSKAHTANAPACQSDTKQFVRQDCRRTGYLLWQEMRYLKWTDHQYRLLDLVFENSLRNGYIDAPFQRQKEIGKALSLSKSHVSEALSSLVNNGVLIVTRRKREPRYKQPTELRIEVVLDMKRWKIGPNHIPRRQPFTDDIRALLERLHRRSNEQIPITDPDSLHSSWQRLILQQSRTFETASEFRLGGDTRCPDEGSMRIDQSDVNWSGNPEAESAAPDGGASSPTAGVMNSDGVAQGGSSSCAAPRTDAQENTGPGPEGNQENSVAAALQMLQEQIEAGQVDPSKIEEIVKSSAIRNFSESQGAQKVPPGGTFSSPDARRPQESSAIRNFSGEPDSKKFPEPAELSDPKVPTGGTFEGAEGKAPVHRARAAVPVPVPVRKSSIDDCSKGNGEQRTNSFSAKQGKPEQEPHWRDNPTDAETELLERIGEEVGNKDVTQWHIHWLCGVIRRHPWEVVDEAIKDIHLHRIENGTFKTSPSAYLKWRINFRYRKWLGNQRKETSP